MKFEQFERLITTFTDGVKLINGETKLMDNYYELLNTSLSSYYTEEGINWVNCYVNKNDTNKTTKVTNIINEPKFFTSIDEDGNLINFTFESDNYDELELTDIYNSKNTYNTETLTNCLRCYGVTDNDGTPVHSDVKTLWTYLETEHKF